MKRKYILFSVSVFWIVANSFCMKLQRANKSTKPKEEIRLPCYNFALSDDPNDVQFFLYGNLRNPEDHEELILYDISSVTSSKFKPKEKTVILIHGFWRNGTSDMPMTLKDSYLNAYLPYNVIVVDWGKLSTPEPNPWYCKGTVYPSVVRGSIPIVSRRVGEFIQFLIDYQFTSLDNIHMIGFSLGAHVSGWAGSLVGSYPQNKGRKVARITGLDPAGPGFHGRQWQRRLSKDDGEFVDVYHTAAGEKETSLNSGIIIKSVGHADFFPNGGRSQPGCSPSSDRCHHAFAFYLFAASIRRDIFEMRACLCQPEFDYVDNSCPGNCSLSVPAGEPCPSSARGQFYFKTEGIPHMLRP